MEQRAVDQQNNKKSNGSQLKNSDISAHWEFSIRILKLNVKMAPEISGFFKWLPLPTWANDSNSR